MKRIKFISVKNQKLNNSKIYSKLPPWIKYPLIPAGDIGWRMGESETYLYEFKSWRNSCLTEESKRNYREVYPAPESWIEYYKNHNADFFRLN